MSRYPRPFSLTATSGIRCGALRCCSDQCTQERLKMASQALLQGFQLFQLIPVLMHSSWHFVWAGALRTVAPTRQRFGRRRSSYKRGASLGLRPVLPRPTGQVRAVVSFKPGFLRQAQARPARHIRTMIMNSFILLSSFVHGFAFPCCDARRAINCFLRFRRNRFASYPATLSLEPGQIFKVQMRRAATSP